RSARFAFLPTCAGSLPTIRPTWDGRGAGGTVVDEADDLRERGALLGPVHRRVVALHGLREVARDRARDQVVDLGGAREIVERAPEGALREVLLDAELAGDLGDRDVEHLLRAVAARDRREEEVRVLLLRRRELGRDVPAEYVHRLGREIDGVAP